METSSNCFLCRGPLQKFLVDPCGDYILNCTGPNCVYGLMHANVIKTEANFGDAPVGIPELDAMVNSYSQGASSHIGFPTPVTFIQPKEETELSRVATASMLEEVVAMPETLTPLTPVSYLGVDDDLSWVRDFMEPPTCKQESAEAPATVTAPCIPRKAVPNAATLQAERKAKMAMVKAPRKTVPKPQHTTVPFNKVTKVLPKQSTPVGAIRSQRVSKKVSLSGTERKKSIAGLLRERATASTDESGSVSSGDSGINSDSSDGLANLSPIQRLLHIQEAHKRKWGTTGMSGFKPTLDLVDRKKKIYQFI